MSQSVMCNISVHMQSMQRNKRCGLAYLYERNLLLFACLLSSAFSGITAPTRSKSSGGRRG
jgi:hypothetical protein